MKLEKAGYLSDLDDSGFLYYGTLTLDDDEVTFSGRANAVGILKQLKISIPLKQIQNVLLKNYIIKRFVLIEFMEDGAKRRVMIRPLKTHLINLFDESKKWKGLLLKNMLKSLP